MSRGGGAGPHKSSGARAGGLKVSSGPGVSQMGEQEAQASEAMLNSAPGHSAAVWSLLGAAGDGAGQVGSFHCSRTGGRTWSWGHL